METFYRIFGEGKDLNTYQMCARGFAIYFIALILIRISGRRTFGKRSSFDNTLTIILGAVLSRAVVGASPFVPTVACSLILVLIHRALAWMAIKNKTIGRSLNGSRIPLFKNDKIINDNLNVALVNEDDLLSDLHLKANSNNFKMLTRYLWKRPAK